MTDRHFVTALARGLDLLRCFDRPGIELTVSELARRVGLNQPTAWRLCHTLIACGFLVRTADGAGLRIGAPALTLGYAAIEGLGFAALALPYMQQITRSIQASTTLSVLDAGEMICVQRCDAEFVLPNQPIGWRSPILSVPSGLAVLAALPEAARAAALRQVEAHEPEAWPRRAMRADKAISDFRRDGMVVWEGMLDGQYSAIALPLVVQKPMHPGESGDLVAWGLTCGGLASRWDARKLREAGAELLRIKDLLEPALGALGRGSAHQQPGAPQRDGNSQM